MKRPIRFSPDAADDLLQVRDWYDTQRSGLGTEFLHQANRTFALIHQMPQLFAKTFRESRLALIDRFAYAVLFPIESEQITVLAVFH